jgi:hypothetical protein
VHAFRPQLRRGVCREKGHSHKLSLLTATRKHGRKEGREV